MISWSTKYDINSHGILLIDLLLTDESLQVYGTIF
jgi:hypothetical protein